VRSTSPRHSTPPRDSLEPIGGRRSTFAKILETAVGGPTPGNGLWPRIVPRGFRLLLGSLLSLLFLWLAFREVPLSEVLATFAVARYRFVALALLLVLLSPLLRAARWRLLYHPDLDGLGVPKLAAVLLVSQMLNIVVPARTGELARIYFMNHTAGRNPARTLGTIVIEKWLDIVMLLVLVSLVPLFVTLPPWFQDSRTTLGVFAALFFGAALALSHGRERVLRLLASVGRFFPAGWRQPVRRALETGLQSLDVLRSPRVGLQLQAWSLTIWLLSALVNYVVLRALGIPLPFAAALFVLVVLQVGVAVPSAPGKLGVFHYLCVLALSVFGIDKSIALGYAVLLYFVVFVPPVVLGALGLWILMTRQEPSTNET